MTVRKCLPVLVLVLFCGVLPCPGDSGRPEPVGLRVPAVTCRFEFRRQGGRPVVDSFEVLGPARHPQYVVKFGNHDGRATLERQEPAWPETFEMKVKGDRDSILSVTLTPEGYGEMDLLFVPLKKWVNYYDGKGKWLGGQPRGESFRLVTEETTEGVDVQVTLPPAARSVRRLRVRFYSTFW